MYFFRKIKRIGVCYYPANGTCLKKIAFFRKLASSNLKLVLKIAIFRIIFLSKLLCTTLELYSENVALNHFHFKPMPWCVCTTRY